MGKLESFNAVSSLILGQSENFIAYKDILGKMSEKPHVHHGRYGNVDCFHVDCRCLHDHAGAEVCGRRAGAQHVQYLYRTVADQPLQS